MDERALQPVEDRNLLRDYLASRDEPCPLCKSNLRALQGSACPECGHELVLKLDLADPVRGAYLAGLRTYPETIIMTILRYYHFGRPCTC